MIVSDKIIEAVAAEARPHQMHPQWDHCMFCGMTAEQIEDFGERSCPRREPVNYRRLIHQ